jgi:hypothetical protein
MACCLVSSQTHSFLGSSAVETELLRSPTDTAPVPSYTSVNCMLLTGQQFGQVCYLACSHRHNVMCHSFHVVFFFFKEPTKTFLLQSGIPVTRRFLPISDHSSLSELLTFLALAKPQEVVALDHAPNDLSRHLPVHTRNRFLRSLFPVLS